MLRGDAVIRGRIDGLPRFRRMWNAVGSRQRMFARCNTSLRAEPSKPGSDEYLALDLSLAWRGRGLPVETPAVALLGGAAMPPEGRRMALRHPGPGVVQDPGADLRHRRIARLGQRLPCGQRGFVLAARKAGRAGTTPTAAAAMVRSAGTGSRVRIQPGTSTSSACSTASEPSRIRQARASATAAVTPAA
jgi:hypothetical protein